MASIVSSVAKQNDQSSGDDSDPEEFLTDDHGQAGETDPPSLDREVTEKSNSGVNTREAPPADFFIPEELKGEIEVGQPNDLFSRDLGEWKVPKLPWCQPSTSGKG